MGDEVGNKSHNRAMMLHIDNFSVVENETEELLLPHDVKTFLIIEYGMKQKNQVQIMV